MSNITVEHLVAVDGDSGRETWEPANRGFLRGSPRAMEFVPAIGLTLEQANELVQTLENMGDYTRLVVR